MTSIIVIGAGLAGSAAAWRLAQRGHDVTVVERSIPANTLGSSSGSARIFRYAYAKPQYVDLVVAAAQGWSELAEAHGRPLITPTDAVDFGTGRELSVLAENLVGAGIAHEVLEAGEARNRWELAFDTPVLWHAGAGVIDAETAVLAMLAQAIGYGAAVHHDWPVARVDPLAAGYQVVRTDGATLDAEQIVVAAGGWLPDLLETVGLPEGFVAAFPPLEVRQEQAYHFPYRDPERAWPTFIHKSSDIEVYGLPGGRDAGWRGQKVAEYHGGRCIPSAAHHDKQLDDTNRRRVIAYVEQFLPGLVPEPYAEATCLFTSTPTEDFVIDRADGITVLSPCSGHGAKFAPLIGELAADLVAGGKDVPEVFRPSALVAR